MIEPEMMLETDASAEAETLDELHRKAWFAPKLIVRSVADVTRGAGDITAPDNGFFAS